MWKNAPRMSPLTDMMDWETEKDEKVASRFCGILFRLTLRPSLLVSGQNSLEIFPAKVIACAIAFFDPNFQDGCRNGRQESIIKTGPHR